MIIYFSFLVFYCSYYSDETFENNCQKNLYLIALLEWGQYCYWPRIPVVDLPGVLLIVVDHAQHLPALVTWGLLVQGTPDSLSWRGISFINANCLEWALAKNYATLLNQPSPPRILPALLTQCLYVQGHNKWSMHSIRVDLVSVQNKGGPLPFSCFTYLEPVRLPVCP